ncbi:MAG: stage II sporulation protein M [Saprospiraceae bacterium]
MRETKFIEQNQEKWQEFENMLQADRHEPERLNDLFIQITDDLSYARTFYPNRSVRVYLNGLAQRVFHNVYRGKRFPKECLRLFWTDELPQLMWEQRRALWLSFGIFVLAFTIGLVSSMIYPEFARVILGDSYVDMTIQNIEKGDPMAVYKESKPLGMTLGIAFNNLRVALMTAILGVFAGIGTVYIMLYNGIMVGAFQYFFVEKGVFWQSFLSIWIHGTLEIGAIIIAGAAGLVAGSGLLFPGTYRRAQAFQRSLRKALKIMLGIAPIIMLAAVFEGYFTRFTETPAFIRGSFIAISLLFMVWYFVWLPWQKARTKGFKTANIEKELPPDRLQVLNFKAIKTSGAILAECFMVLQRHGMRIGWAVLGATSIFLSYTFAFSPLKPIDIFSIEDGFMGKISSTDSFFSNETAPLLAYVQLGLLACLAFVALFSLEQEIPEQDRALRSPLQSITAATMLILSVALFPVLLKANIGFFGWMIAIPLFPALGLCSAVLYFETANPLQALLRSAQLLDWRQTILLGSLTINLSLLLFVFLDTPIWEIILTLFSWMAPSTEVGTQIFNQIANAFVSSVLLYALLVLQVIAGGLLYFSSKEMVEAHSLNEAIKTIGTHRKIRGLARE